VKALNGVSCYSCLLLMSVVVVTRVGNGQVTRTNLVSIISTIELSITSTKEVMFLLQFVCLSVSRFLLKKLRINFDEIFMKWLERGRNS